MKSPVSINRTGRKQCRPALSQGAIGALAYVAVPADSSRQRSDLKGTGVLAASVGMSDNRLFLPPRHSGDIDIAIDEVSLPPNSSLNHRAIFGRWIDPNDSPKEVDRLGWQRLLAGLGREQAWRLEGVA